MTVFLKLSRLSTPQFSPYCTAHSWLHFFQILPTSLWYITPVIFLTALSVSEFPCVSLCTRPILLTLIWINLLPSLLLYLRCWEMLDEIRVEGTEIKLMVSTVTCSLSTALNQLFFYTPPHYYCPFSQETKFLFHIEKKCTCQDRCTPCWIISPSIPIYLCLFYHLVSS